MMNFPAELKYSKSHEWVKMDGDVAVIGISDFAQDALGSDPYGAWIIKVSPVTDTEALLDAAAYEAHCAQEG